MPDVIQVVQLVSYVLKRIQMNETKEDKKIEKMLTYAVQI